MNEEDIFHEALARKLPAERAAYLEQACAGDTALRASVEALLRANVGASGFMDLPVAAVAATVDEPISERRGTVIGPYKLMEQIGEGGMGLVFVAEQQHPVRRKVALKVIKPGMDTRGFTGGLRHRAPIPSNTGRKAIFKRGCSGRAKLCRQPG